MTTLAPIADKLQRFIRLLASDRDGEVVAAARALVRTLKTNGADIHALADAIVQSPLSEPEMKKLYDACYERGRLDERRAAENGPMFRNVVNVDDEPSWNEIARECAANPARMKSEREKDFVKQMVRRTAHGGEPSPKQADWLRKIYARVH
jgi:hypothetical protein